MSVQVEVSIQDCFFTSSPSAEPELLSGKISPETWEIWFRCWLETLSPDLLSADAYELSLRLTTDEEVQALNAKYRHKDQPTDVLAFAALEVDFPQSAELLESLPLYLGDIVISVDTADRQAQQQGHPLKIELAWLAAHGLLHLVGWDHPNEDSLIQMLAQQETLLQSIGLEI